jgi:hypothetical protein
MEKSISYGKEDSMNEPIAYTVSEPPHYAITCVCGVTINGTSERGLSALLKRHHKDGVIHKEWEAKA